MPDDHLLLETGDGLLLESGDALLLESSADEPQGPRVRPPAPTMTVFKIL